ncbi:transcriptional regulator FeaR [Marinobacter halodurans]|uniref:Transcriptional regulator FeaR n=1 Tax=Marinobacter halodurans TaxID=2528979 RepID=A0ABY1ZTW9_9GAMM|nr:transcriptional regulator FeaR [Marinobacter halodurans]TBW59529.1 transcriptional regulator FeaR [Marinobacter halodurans]
MQSAQRISNSLERWNQELREMCGPFRTETTHQSSLFIGNIAVRERAGLTLASVKTNADSICRDAARSRLDDRFCFLVSQRRGYSSIQQDDLHIELSPGDLILMDSVGACSIRPAGLIEHASLCLPREDVVRSLSKDQPLFGKISSRCASGRILHSMFEELCNDRAQPPSADAEQLAILSACTALLGPALTSERDEAPDYASLSGAALRNYAERLIDENLTAPNLNPAMLANELNISVRHLYRLFEEEGDSVCRYIQRARLQKSANDLSNPRLRQETITSIAYRWGFSDSAHFSRSFKKEFDLSPRAYRIVELGL